LKICLWRIEAKEEGKEERRGERERERKRERERDSSFHLNLSETFWKQSARVLMLTARNRF
jgi:hypothetical protein